MNSESSRNLEASVLLSWRELNPDGWQEVVGEIINIFLEHGPRQHGVLLKAHSRRDRQGIAAAAHTLKSSCGNVGAMRASRLLETIENGVAVLAWHEVDALISELEQALSESHADLHAFIEDHAA